MQAVNCNVMQEQGLMWAHSLTQATNARAQPQMCRQIVCLIQNDHMQPQSETVQQSRKERTSSIRYVFLTRARSVLAGPLSFFCRMRMAR